MDRPRSRREGDAARVRGAIRMIKAKQGYIKDLTDDDVLRVDPVREYERRQIMREVSTTRLAQIRDESDDLVAMGRPTGP